MRSIEHFGQSIDRNLMRFEEAQVWDLSFIENVGYALDTRVQCWLNQCEINGERELVDDSLINFDPIINTVITDLFVQDPPVCIKRVTTEEEKKDQNVHQMSKNRKRSQHQETKVSNEKRIGDWFLKEGKNINQHCWE